jgi:hypothetical protein
MLRSSAASAAAAYTVVAGVKIPIASLIFVGAIVLIIAIAAIVLRARGDRP